MTASSRYTRAISSEVGDIERRLRMPSERHRETGDARFIERSRYR